MEQSLPIWETDPTIFLNEKTIRGLMNPDREKMVQSITIEPKLTRSYPPFLRTTSTIVEQSNLDTPPEQQFKSTLRIFTDQNLDQREKPVPKSGGFTWRRSPRPVEYDLTPVGDPNVSEINQVFEKDEMEWNFTINYPGNERKLSVDIPDPWGDTGNSFNILQISFEQYKDKGIYFGVKEQLIYQSESFKLVAYQREDEVPVWNEDKKSKYEIESWQNDNLSEIFLRVTNKETRKYIDITFWPFNENPLQQAIFDGPTARPILKASVGGNFRDGK